MEGNMEIQESNIVKAFGRKWWILSSCITLLACSPTKSTVPYYFTPDLSPTWSLKTDAELLHTISDFSFVNQDGNAFGSEQLKSKTYVANFFFTSCPSICPKMTNNLSKISMKYSNAEDLALVSFSVTPDMDSVPVLRDYHAAYDMPTNWHLLTGNQTDIYNLSRQSFFVEEEIGLSKDSSDFLHTERCVLVDSNGYIRGVYNATVALDIERLIDDIEFIRENAK
jgi:protein SCO1